MSHPKIAVVDDQEAVRSALGDMLGVYGYQVELQESGDAFLASPGAGRDWDVRRLVGDEGE